MIRLLAFAAMAVVWGLTWLAAKWAFEGGPPIFVAGFRLCCACVCFLLWVLAARAPLAVRQPARLVGSALLLNTGSYSLVFWGVAHAPSGLAAVINLSLIPVFSIAVGALYGEERVTGRRLVALGVGIVGLALLFSGRSGGGGAADGTPIALGLAAVVAGTLFYAWGAVAARPLARAMPPVALAFWHTLIGGLSLLLLSAAIEGFDPGRLAAIVQPRPLAGVAFLVFGGSLVGFTAYLWLLREWGAFRASLYAFVSPVIAVATGVLALGEPFGVREGLAMAIMLAATALVLRPEPSPAS